MNVNILVILVCVFSLVFGSLIGVGIFKLYNYRLNKKLLKNATEVLEGKRDNKIIIDGKKYDATKFRIRDDSDKEILIDLKGGGTIQYGKIKEKGTSCEIKDSPDLGGHDFTDGEDSNSTRKEKRTSSTRPRRTRKF